MRIVSRAWIYGFFTESLLLLLGLLVLLAGDWGSSGPSSLFSLIIYGVVLFFHLPSFTLWFFWDFWGSDWAPLFYGYLLSVFILQTVFFSLLWNIWLSRKRID